MALILITGYPCCGKTTFVKKLEENLNEYINNNNNNTVNRVIVIKWI